MAILYSLFQMLNEMSPYILFGFLIAGIIHAFVSRDTMSHHLSGSGWKSVVKAAAIGVPLPLCSCGVLPTAIAMRRAGASRASTTSFLIATPQTGVDSIAATWSLLGPAFAVIRPVAALATAVLGGISVGKVESSKHPSTETDTKDSDLARHLHTVSICCNDGDCTSDKPLGFVYKCVAALKYGFVDLVSSIGGWLVLGLIIAALITVFVPADFFTFLGSNPIPAMIMVLVIAIPMYVCATGSIPIALALMLKGLSPGTALVMLMAGPAANFASFTLISREMGRRATIVYVLAIVVGSMLFGIAIDYILPAEWFKIKVIESGNCHAHFAVFPSICSAILVILLVYSFIRRYFNKHTINTQQMIQEFTITGMNCPHCQASVTKAISVIDGVTDVVVDLKGGKATVAGEVNPEAIVAAVRAAGFDAVPKA